VPSYAYLIHDAKTGVLVDDVPLQDVQFTDALTGIGTAQAKIPLDHPKATRSVFGGRTTGDRELTIIRDDNTLAWHGPIVKKKASLKEGFLTLECADPFWYLTKRVMEGERRYTRVPMQIARDLFLNGVNKTGTTASSQAPLYRYTCDNKTNGTVVAMNVAANDRLNVGRAIMDLAATADFDFRFDSTYNASTHDVSRNLRFGYPNISRVITDRRLEIGNGLEDLVVEESLDRAGNRIHVLGAGTGNKRIRAVVNNGTSANKHVVLEEVIDAQDVTSQAVVNSMANFYRSIRNPPLVTYTATFRPSAALPFDWALPGDSIKVVAGYGYLDENVNRRVVAVTTRVDNDGNGETIDLSFFSPEDEQ
jgi:hypothetical protein